MIKLKNIIEKTKLNKILLPISVLIGAFSFGQTKQNAFNTLGKNWPEPVKMQPAVIILDGLDSTEKPEDLGFEYEAVEPKNPIGNVEIRNSVNNFPLAFPLRKLKIGSSIGWRFHPVYHKMMFHNGVDCAAGNDTVFAVCTGKVAVNWDIRSGIYIKVLGGRLQAGYAHLSQIFVLPDENVYVGQPIGITGRTGAATGNHLHFTLRIDGNCVDPVVFFKIIGHNIN